MTEIVIMFTIYGYHSEEESLAPTFTKDHHTIRILLQLGKTHSLTGGIQNEDIYRNTVYHST